MFQVPFRCLVALFLCTNFVNSDLSTIELPSEVQPLQSTEVVHVDSGSKPTLPQSTAINATTVYSTKNDENVDTSTEQKPPPSNQTESPNVNTTLLESTINSDQNDFSSEKTTVDDHYTPDMSSGSESSSITVASSTSTSSTTGTISSSSTSTLSSITTTLSSTMSMPMETTPKEESTEAITEAQDNDISKLPLEERPSESMSSGTIALVMAIVFAVVVVLVYVGLLSWRRYLEYRYGNRELLVNDLEFDTNDLRHFEL